MEQNAIQKNIKSGQNEIKKLLLKATVMLLHTNWR